LIVGRNVRLRAVARDDLPRFVEWFSDPDVRRFLDMYLPFSLAQEERWFENLLDRMEKREVVMFTIETKDDEARIGNVSLFNINWKDRHAELGITIGNKACWNRGYGTDAMRTMLGLAFDEMNLHRVVLRVHADNARAIRAYEKVGFQHEGVLRESVFREGVYYDMVLMGILDEEFERRD
jgi:RimJ/RimL family protein N-acetyltransferase